MLGALPLAQLTLLPPVVPPVFYAVGLNYAETVHSPMAIAGGDALGYVEYFAELLDAWAQEADADERLYRLGVAMLDALSAGVPVEPLARYFECWLLRLQGVYPGAGGDRSQGAESFLAASRGVAPRDVAGIPATRAVLRELEHVHRTLISMHLEKTLKSDRVLRDLGRHSSTS